VREGASPSSMLGAESQRPAKGTEAASATAAKDWRSSGLSETASMITEYPAASVAVAFWRSAS
jgi:hypothetical protein